jgi:signal transduction histidine kinase/ActR/RegA family two-component response regulator
VSQTITTVAIVSEGDLVFLRQRTRRTAELLGFSTEDQTRIATAVSEIGRNALTYGGGGKAELALAELGQSRTLIIRITDKGPGISDLTAVLEGRYHSIDGMGLGVTGARRLMDDFRITTSSGGTTVEMAKTTGRGSQPLSVVAMVDRLARDSTSDPALEIRIQNQELLRALEANAQRQDELARVNAKLEETNEGVRALYAELDRRAKQLEAFNAELEAGIAAALAERDRSEAQLRQAQKMEALGQLTGGVAHDFNNLLQVIVGNLEMLQRLLPEEEIRPRRLMANALEGAGRAATLTQRLLSFSRLQPLDPSPIDVERLTRGMFDILRRTLGEQVEMKVVIDAGLWFAQADPHQLENAVVNLAVNARHAMAKGGSVEIRARNVTEENSRSVVGLSPANYVAVSVADTGSGIPPELLAKVFEPFFTTKEVGQGTGLGLSQVYGFAKQSGGGVKIESTLGVGTCVTIFLPKSDGRPAPQARPVVPLAALAATGKVVLVVEDDEQVGNYTVEALRELGYTVRRASDGASALRTINSGDPIDLLFTDVILPGGISGRQLADEAIAQRPNLKVLYASGYAWDAVAHGGRLDPGVDLLPKPFSYDELRERVGRALASPEGDGPPGLGR